MTTADTFHRAWKALPVGQLDQVIGSGTCLILAPHPDDESLGCGGLIAACVAANRPPLVVVLTDGTGSHPRSHEFPPDRLRAVRSQELIDAVGHLGLPRTRVVFLNQPDTAAPTTGPALEAVVASLAALIEAEPACHTILAPWRHDPHCDHLAASIAAQAAARITGIRHIAYPVWGWTLPPNSPVAEAPTSGWRLDISAHRSAKHAAIQSHRSQYGNLITDDPTGFQLPPNLLSVFDRDFETFIPA